MKYAHFFVLVTGMWFTACKKSGVESNKPELRGINFDLLLKTIDKYPDGESITNYTYNLNNQLIQEDFTRDFTDGTKWKVTNNWYRNPQGEPDSMKSEYIYGTGTTGLQKQYYHYDAAKRILYSIQFRNINDPYASIDSSIYIYSGTTIIKKLDYTSAKSTILNNTLTHEMYYQYDTLNNIRSITFVNYDFSRGVPARQDTVILAYAYDNKKNPYSQNDAFYQYFANLAFSDYVSKNNIVKILYSGASTSNDKDEFSFQYNVANKPDKVLVTSFGVGSTQPFIWTTDYYYN